MTRTTLGLAALALSGLAACGGERARPAATDSLSTLAAGSAVAVDSKMLIVSRGAAVAIAVEAAPDKADSVLAAEGMTGEEYELLMYRIAADTVLSRLFEEALQGR